MIQTLKANARRLSQGAFLLLTLHIGWRFALWVIPLMKGQLPGVSRPAAVDAFLPLSGLLNLKFALATGSIHGAHPAALLILLAVCASALIVKKGFCSFVCPVGFAGEMMEKLGERARLAKRLPRKLDLPLRGVKYLLLAFFLWNIVFQMPGIAAGQFLSSGYNITADIRMFLFFATPTTAAFLTGFCLVGLPFIIRGGWCRYLCPYGALLGLISFLSPFKVHRDKEACISCGKCRKACPSSLGVDTSLTVLSDECTGCLTCVESCPEPEALRLSTSSRGMKLSASVVAVIMASIFILTSVSGRLSGKWESNVKGRSLIMHVMMMKMERR